MDESDPPRKNLANVAADLLSYRRSQSLLGRIFAAPARRWQRVASCYTGVIELSELAVDVFAAHAERFVVTYLPWPGLPTDDPGCMVVFVHDYERLSAIAFFDRAGFEKV